ncbi:MAG: hypothetical protein CMJ64_19435 [Planctomycetaceae bacterium]|nr:hypothetical protein [Planctomycetaceae bacterium]
MCVRGQEFRNRLIATMVLALGVSGGGEFVWCVVQGEPFRKRLRASHARVQAVAIDMSPAYIQAVEKHLPDADLVFDHFHLVKLLNDKLTQLRRDLYREAKDKLHKRVERPSLLGTSVGSTVSIVGIRQSGVARQIHFANDFGDIANSQLRLAWFHSGQQTNSLRAKVVFVHFGVPRTIFPDLDIAYIANSIRDPSERRHRTELLRQFFGLT